MDRILELCSGQLVPVDVHETIHLRRSSDKKQEPQREDN